MNSNSLEQFNERIQQEARFTQTLITEMRRVLIGQDRLLNRLLIALLSDGHVLIEGVPGLAKTLAVRTLAATIHAQFQRVQFTPDLLPADVMGTEVYNPRSGEFKPKPGPVFSNIVLADEINRAPAKVQSALLEAMEERQVTIGDETYALPEPFMVLATQNPIEQEGTYPLPEAQLDRFMLKVVVDYPTRKEERAIVDLMGGQRPEPPQAVIELDVIARARQVIHTIYVDEKIKDYILDLIIATRQPSEYALSSLSDYIEFGVSPRATIFTLKAAKTYAFLRGRGYVTPDDVKAILPDVLRHRIGLTYAADADEITTDYIIRQILSRVQVP